MAEALKKRSEMDPQFQWDLRDLIPTEKALEELFSELESGIGRYEGFKGRLGEDAAVLKEYLDHDVAMDLKFSRLLAYAIQKRDEDTSQSASQALLSRAQLLLSRGHGGILLCRAGAPWDTGTGHEGLPGRRSAFRVPAVSGADPGQEGAYAGRKGGTAPGGLWPDGGGSFCDLYHVQ